MVASAAVQHAGEDLYKGVTLLSSATQGRFSLFDQLVLKRRSARIKDSLTLALGLTPAEVLALYYEPRYSLRPVQMTPSAVWRTWFFLGGRGTGKTHAGASAVIEEARADPHAVMLIVGPTDSEIRKNQLEGSSGILTLSPPWFRPVHKRSKRMLVWPNGAVAHYVPAQAGPDKFRGYNVSFVWADEIVAWKKHPEDVYDQCRTKCARIITPRMERLGLPARVVITTTPAPTPLFRQILKDKDRLFLAQSTTFDNAANLDPSFIRQALALASSTDGRREYGGELFFPMDATLYKRVNWDASRVESVETIPARDGKTLFDKVVVSVDPATGEKKGADLHGIVVVGIREEADGLLHTYVLQDLSLQEPEPTAWAKVAVDAVHRWKHLAPPRKAFVFAETNTGGSMVKSTIRGVDAKVKVKGMRAMQSKAERAAPVTAQCEAGLVHMVGKHHKLEKQLSEFTGQEGGHGRDDRADAFAWPIYLYVCPKRQNAGAAGRAGEQQGSGEGDDEDEE